MVDEQSWDFIECERVLQGNWEREHAGNLPAHGVSFMKLMMQELKELLKKIRVYIFQRDFFEESTEHK